MPPSGNLDDIELALLQSIEKAGIYGIRIWELLNQVASEQDPKDRHDTRMLRLELWRKLRRLLKIGVITRRARIWVTSYDLPRLTANRRRRSRGGSTTKRLRQIPDKNRRQMRKPLATHGFHQNPPASKTNPGRKTESATPDHAALVKVLAVQDPATDPEPSLDKESVSKLAGSLARLPRKRHRRWTGWIAERHGWQNQEILLSDGRKVFLYGALRGKVVWISAPTNPNGDSNDANWDWGVTNAHQVSFPKDPNAVALGRMKAGVREKASEAKTKAARANGLKPCRPGRRRGRPRVMR